MKAIISLLIIVFMASCGPSDNTISTEVTTALAGAGANISAQVSKGVVTLTGQCPDESCKTSSESAVKNVKGVKQVINNITIAEPIPAPAVTINPDDSLKTSLSELVKAYPKVKATVSEGVVTLTGEIKRSQLAGLMQKISATKPKKIENKLEIK